MKERVFGVAVALLSIATMLTSCESGYDCSLENTAYDRIGFYKMDANGAEKIHAFPEALTVSLVVNGRDSIVVNHIENAEMLQLPMSYTSECDTVIFSYEGDFTDTLYIGHQNIPYYVSMECGTVMYHKLTEIRHTGNLIDSAAIVRNYVKFDHNENIKLYFID